MNFLLLLSRPSQIFSRVKSSSSPEFTPYIFSASSMKTTHSKSNPFINSAASSILSVIVIIGRFKQFAIIFPHTVFEVPLKPFSMMLRFFPDFL